MQSQWAARILPSLSAFPRGTRGCNFTAFDLHTVCTRSLYTFQMIIFLSLTHLSFTSEVLKAIQGYIAEHAILTVWTWMENNLHADRHTL